KPPIQRRSITIVRCPDCAKCQARYFPPSPLPMMMFLYFSVVIYVFGDKAEVDGPDTHNVQHALQLGVSQPKRVGDHGNRAERHGCACNHRAQQSAEEWIQDARRNRNAEDVIDERKEQVLPNVAHRCPAEPQRTSYVSEIALDQRDTGAFHCYIRSRPHRDADVSLGQSRSIVYAITGHRNYSA